MKHHLACDWKSQCPFVAAVDHVRVESAGTIVIDTPNKFLYLVQGDGTAPRYGVGVGRPGFTRSGTNVSSGCIRMRNEDVVI